jgi:hypothetical protein
MWLERKVLGWLRNGSCTASFTSLSANRWPLTALLTGQTDGNWKGPSLDCGQVVEELRKSAAECWSEVYPAMTSFLSFCANGRPQFIPQYVTIIYTYYRDTSVHIMFNDRPLEVPQHCQQKLTGTRMRFGFFGRFVFLLHTPPFGFWFMMMNHNFIPSNDEIQ